MTEDNQTPESQQPESAPRRRGKQDPNRAAEFDPTNHQAVADYIDANGFEAFVTERNRQTGFTVTETSIAPKG